MRKLLIWASVFCGSSLSASLSVYDLKCEYKENPVGIDTTLPRVSWKVKSGGRSVTQAAYQIRAANSIKDLADTKTLLWDSGKVLSDQSIHIPYSGPALESRQRVYWQVRIWDNLGKSCQWSLPVFWEMGLLEPSDWQAEWIEPDRVEDPNISNPCPFLRKEFSLDKEIISARAYVTSHGLYQMEINGQVVGEDLFTPGWTSYQKRLQYQVYDVTDLLKKNANCVGVVLGDGWYRGFLVWREHRNTYGKDLALLAEIEVIYKDGTQAIIGTDSSWKASTGPILKSDIYNGEVYDSRLEMTGWSESGFDDSVWAEVSVKNHSKDILVASAGVPVRRIEEIKPIKLLKAPNGQDIIDLGQNMIGWLRFKVEGPAGTRIKLQHAEVLDAQGNLYTDNLRDAEQTIEYIVKGSGKEVFEPHFTFQGFRYVSVQGWPQEISLDDFTGVVIHSDIEPTGTFECSNPAINQLQHNIQWGQKGNFLDVPTDCPQRDERLGWTGDAQVFAPAACFNFDVAAFYTKWLADLAADQKPNGAVPHVIPDVLSESASAGWADSATIVPWVMYLYYGDTGILEQQYGSMKAWVDYMTQRAGDNFLWDNDFTFGDWLAYSSNRSDYPGATTKKTLVSQAYFARSTEILRQTAKILGKTKDARRYSELLKNIKQAFKKEFVTANGCLVSHTQTAYSLALEFGLLDADLRDGAAKRLAGDVNKFKHITTGFLGTPLICHVLSDYGYLDEAYLLLNRREYPSWLYPIVAKGATTIWERWDGIKPDGSFQDAGMNSFNHYAYGAIGDWLYGVVAGVKIDERAPGYKHIIIDPHPGGGLSYAKISLESMYGTIQSGWEIKGDSITLTVEIPPNTTATLKLPVEESSKITESDASLDKTNGILSVKQRQQKVIVCIGSGRYEFKYPK